MAANRKQFVIKMEMKGGKLVATDVKNIEKSLGKADVATKGMLGSMDKLKSMVMAGGVFYMAQRAIRGMTLAAIELEAQLAQVSTMLTKQTMHHLPQYRREIIRMAADFGEGTATLTKGTYDILSASVDASKAMEFLRVSAIAAKAGITDTGIAADALTTIINSYQMQAEEASRVSDILFGIVKRGKTTFAELAPQIGMVTATAAQAGLRLEELGAFLATATRAGLRTEMAVTGLANILTAFLKPMDGSIKAARELGFELNTNTLRTIGLHGIMKKLNTASAEQLALIFPNIRGLRGFAAAMSDTAGFAKDLDMILKDVGTTQVAFQKQMDTTQTKMDRAWQITLNWGRELGGPFKSGLDTAARSLIYLNEQIEKHKKLGFGFSGLWLEYYGPEGKPGKKDGRTGLGMFAGGAQTGPPGPIGGVSVPQRPGGISAPPAPKMPRDIWMGDPLGTGMDAYINRMEFFQEAAERAFAGANRSMERFTLHGQANAMILGNSFSNAFAMMSSGATTAGDAITKAMLGALGQIASMWGQTLLLAGVGFGALPGGWTAARAVPAGIALMALGGTISGLAGRGGGGYGGGGYGGGYGGYNAPGQGTAPATQIIIIRGGDGESIDSALNRAGVDRALRNRLYELGRTGDLDFLRS